jgi:hypothetical protein
VGDAAAPSSRVQGGMKIYIKQEAFLPSTDINLQGKIKGNSINDCNFFKVHNFC